MNLTLCENLAKVTRLRPQKSTSSSVKLKPNKWGSGFKKYGSFKGTKRSKMPKEKCTPHFENEFKDIRHASRIKYSNTRKYFIYKDN